MNPGQVSPCRLGTLLRDKCPPGLDKQRHYLEEQWKRSLGQRIAVSALEVRPLGVAHAFLDLVPTDRRTGDCLRERMGEGRLPRSGWPTDDDKRWLSYLRHAESLFREAHARKQGSARRASSTPDGGTRIEMRPSAIVPRERADGEL